MKSGPSPASGTWDLTIRTPIGKQSAVIVLTETPSGLDGVAQQEDGAIALQDVTLSDETLRWNMSITKPLRLNLAFEVLHDGDTLTGFSKAGRLPRSSVTGTRRLRCFT